MNHAPTPDSANFWHKFCRLFCPFPAGCSADVYLSLQQKQMLLERKGLLATLQSFPDLLQDSDKLQHTALVTLEEHQRAQVLMRYKDFFHPKETLPAATIKPTNNVKVQPSVTLSPDIHVDEQQVDKATLKLERKISTLQPDENLDSDSQISNNKVKHSSLKRTSITESLGDTFSPYARTENNKDPKLEQLAMQTSPILQNPNLNETDILSESIENNFDILKFQQILASLPDVLLFNALCKKCAASVRKHPTQHGRKLLRLILQNNSDANDVEISEQEYDKLEFRTQLELFNSIGRPATPTHDNSIADNYIPNAIDYTTHLSGIASDIREIASRKSRSLLELRGMDKVIPGLPAHVNYQSIADQFHRAELSRQRSNGGRTWRRRDRRDLKDKTKRRTKRMVLKTQVCPVVQSWSNLVLAKTANGTLVQIAQV